MSPASKYANALLPNTLALFGAFIAASSQSVISFFHTKFAFMVMPISRIGTRYGMNLILERSRVHKGGDEILLYFLRGFTERIERYIRPKIMRDADIVDMSMKDVSGGISGSVCGPSIGMKSHLR